MAKKPQYNFQKDSRANRIKNCTRCNGAPPITESDLQGMEIKFCDLCLEIVEWNKIGKPITIKDKKVLHTVNSANIKETTIIETEIIPGQQLSFNDITI